jgi:replicative DNA helicase
MAFEAVARTPALRGLVVNVEMSPAALLDRQLARLAGIDLTLIRHRRLGAGHAAAVERGMSALGRVGERIAFLRPRYDLTNVAASADAFEAGLIVFDYIQRIGPPGEHGDRRGAVDATMSYLRQFADAGTAIIVVAALARSKDAKGRSSYQGDGLGLASFRETSELEYGADDAFILAPADGEGDSPSPVVLKHLKSRYGEARDIPLTFDRPHQRFTPAGPTEPPARGDRGKLQDALQARWDSTGPAHDGGEGDSS